MDDNLVLSVGGGSYRHIHRWTFPTEKNPLRSLEPNPHLNHTEYTFTAMEIELIVVFLCPFLFIMECDDFFERRIKC